MILEYCTCLEDLPKSAPDILTKLTELLKVIQIADPILYSKLDTYVGLYKNVGRLHKISSFPGYILKLNSLAKQNISLISCVKNTGTKNKLSKSLW